MLTRRDLFKAKTRALRHRIWFKTLSRVERSIVDLTIRCVEKIRSQELAYAILNILNKLWRSLEEGFVHQAEKIGRRIAQEICEAALKWGNRQAWTWKDDRKFIRFLGVNALNT